MILMSRDDEFATYEILNVPKQTMIKTMQKEKDYSKKTKISANKVEHKYKNENVSKEEMKEMVKKIERSLHLFGTDAKYEVDFDTKIVSVKIIDRDTHEVIREIPAKDAVEKFLAMKKIMGLIFDVSA